MHTVPSMLIDYRGSLITHKKLPASLFMKHDISIAQPIKELHEEGWDDLLYGKPQDQGYHGELPFCVYKVKWEWPVSGQPSVLT